MAPPIKGRKTKPANPIHLHLVPCLPRSEGDPFTRTELAEARRLMRALSKIIDGRHGCPVARSVLGDPPL